MNGQQIINNWTDHGLTTNTSAAINLTGGTKVPITVEYYENVAAPGVFQASKMTAPPPFS